MKKVHTCVQKNSTKLTGSGRGGKRSSASIPIVHHQARGKSAPRVDSGKRPYFERGKLKKKEATSYKEANKHSRISARDWGGFEDEEKMPPRKAHRNS